MADKAQQDEAPQVTIRNVTRTSLSIHVPGECVRLQPGQSAQVHKAYLDTAELRTLCQQGAVTSLPVPAAARAAADEESTDGESDTPRRGGSRRR